MVKENELKVSGSNQQNKRMSFLTQEMIPKKKPRLTQSYTSSVVITAISLASLESFFYFFLSRL